MGVEMSGASGEEGRGGGGREEGGGRRTSVDHSLAFFPQKPTPNMFHTFFDLELF